MTVALSKIIGIIIIEISCFWLMSELKECLKQGKESNEWNYNHHMKIKIKTHVAIIDA